MVGHPHENGVSVFVRAVLIDHNARLHHRIGNHGLIMECSVAIVKLLAAEPIRL
jgi:hypothetical protein